MTVRLWRSRSLARRRRRRQRQRQRGQVLATDMGELDALEVVPDALIAIELGGVAGRPLQVEALGRAPREEVLGGPVAMDRRPLPDDEQLAADLAQQQAREAHDVRAAVACSCVCMKRRPSAVAPLIAERWSWVSGAVKRGVCPQGAHVRTASGNK
jgi:hypothetical protein